MTHVNRNECFIFGPISGEVAELRSLLSMLLDLNVTSLYSFHLLAPQLKQILGDDLKPRDDMWRSSSFYAGVIKRVLQESQLSILFQPPTILRLPIKLLEPSVQVGAFTLNFEPPTEQCIHPVNVLLGDQLQIHQSPPSFQFASQGAPYFVRFTASEDTLNIAAYYADKREPVWHSSLQREHIPATTTE